MFCPKLVLAVICLPASFAASPVNASKPDKPVFLAAVSAAATAPRLAIVPPIPPGTNEVNKLGSCSPSVSTK